MITSTDGHMGWTNKETWNTNLWMTNEESVYKLLRIIARKCYNVGELADNMEGFLGLLWEGKTPDGERLEPVDWVQIAEAWAEANELFDYKLET